MGYNTTLAIRMTLTRANQVALSTIRINDTGLSKFAITVHGGTQCFEIEICSP